MYSVKSVSINYEAVLFVYIVFVWCTLNCETIMPNDTLNISITITGIGR